MIASAYELNLHRDPDEVTPNLPPAEKNERRRIFWTLYVFESMARPILGKTYQPFDEDAITTSFPIEPVEGEDPIVGSSPNALFLAAALNARVSKLMNRRQAVSHEDVVQALDELNSFIGRYDDRPLSTAMSRYSYNRLYRFAARLGLTNQGQDITAAKHFGALRLDPLERTRQADQSLFAEDLLLTVETLRQTPMRASTLVLLRVIAAAIDAAVDLHGES